MPGSDSHPGPVSGELRCRERTVLEPARAEQWWGCEQGCETGEAPDLFKVLWWGRSSEEGCSSSKMQNGETVARQVNGVGGTHSLNTIPWG